MLNKPDQKTLEALAWLGHNEHFQIVLKWLAESRDQLRMDNDGVETLEALRQNQGAIFTITKFLRATENAPEDLRRLKDR